MQWEFQCSGFLAKDIDKAVDGQIAAPVFIVREGEFPAYGFPIMVCGLMQGAMGIIMPGRDVQGVHIVVVEARVPPFGARGRRNGP